MPNDDLVTHMYPPKAVQGSWTALLALGLTGILAFILAFDFRATVIRGIVHAMPVRTSASSAPFEMRQMFSASKITEEFRHHDTLLAYDERWLVTTGVLCGLAVLVCTFALLCTSCCWAVMRWVLRRVGVAAIALTIVVLVQGRLLPPLNEADWQRLGSVVFLPQVGILACLAALLQTIMGGGILVVSHWLWPSCSTNEALRSHARISSDREALRRVLDCESHGLE